MVTEMPEGLYQDWHPASRRQLLIVLFGTLEVETSDGKKHRCSSGEVFLADDVGSRGHRTRTIGGPARVLFVHLPTSTTARLACRERGNPGSRWFGSSHNARGYECRHCFGCRTSP